MVRFPADFRAKIRSGPSHDPPVLSLPPTRQPPDLLLFDLSPSPHFRNGLYADGMIDLNARGSA
jgi:hypothetical protein